MSGSVQVTVGAFAGTNGIWSATKSTAPPGQPPAETIPTLHWTGLAFLAGLLLLFGLIRQRRGIRTN